MILEDMTPEQIDQEIAKHEFDIQKLKDAKEAVQAMTPAQQLATVLHKKQCHWNHTDGCSWYYEKWSNKISKHSSRRTYLDKAQKLLDTGKSLEELIGIVEFMHG